MSDVISQSRPKLRCVGGVSPLKSRSLTTGAQSSVGKASDYWTVRNELGLIRRERPMFVGEG